MTGRTNTGAALLEVLLATSVVTIAMGVSFSSLSEITRQESRLHDRSTGRYLAQSQLHILRGSGRLVPGEEQAGAFDSPYEEFSWRFRVEPASGPTGTSIGTIDVNLKGEDSPVYRATTIVAAPGT